MLKLSPGRATVSSKTRARESGPRVPVRSLGSEEGRGWVVATVLECVRLVVGWLAGLEARWCAARGLLCLSVRRPRGIGCAVFCVGFSFCF